MSAVPRSESADEPGALPRKSPCASCPYRQSVPSGIWHEEEYAKLERYDGDIPEQSSARVFSCHQGQGEVCSGWLGHRDPAELLAVRVGVIDGRLDPSCLDYSTDVELFASGAEAAAHGRRDIAAPSESAHSTIAKIRRVRGDTLTA